MNPRPATGAGRDPSADFRGCPRRGTTRSPLGAAGLACGMLVLAACAGHGTGPVALVGATSTTPSPPVPAVQYELTHDPAAACWRARLRATGIDAAAGDLRLVLEDWGEWTEVGATYLGALEVRPPAKSDPRSRSRFPVAPPPDWDGTLEASYVIPLARVGSRTRQSHGLLPKHDGGEAAGFSINTFFDLFQGGKPLDAVRTIRFAGPPDATIATGWGGVSTGSQEVRFRHPIDNVPLLFGRSAGLSTAEVDGCRYEIAQFGAGPDATPHVLRVARSLVPLYGRHSGRPHDEPVRVLLTPLSPGGTNTDHGCVVGLPDRESDGGLPPEFVRLLAHELFHDWLGGYLDPPDDESLVWFHEGFTEYLALWHVAAAGLLGPDWFAERVVGADAAARGSEAFGRVTFADPKVRWRDGNGPNETLGYQGGTTLAFFADVELRRRGRPGLMGLVAGLLRGEDRRLTIDGIREWMESNGLAGFYADHVARPAALPELDSALREVGFESFGREASLTYLGIQAEGEDLPCRIVALDPEGPAARVGARIGDRVLACSPSRMNPPGIGDDVATPYRFGLNTFASGAEIANLEVTRDGKDLTIGIQPRLIPGGFRVAYRARDGATERFFRYDPQQDGR
ncbi:MAG: hypothetical protein L0323_07955 [Planctomycetes bacterium]|nr:hypothetical protein [Planctomycetota bacterium]